MFDPDQLQGTDAGLVAIGARFSAAAGAGLGQGADEAVDDVMGRRRWAWANKVRSVPIYATSLGASGTISQPGTLGPPTGFYWGVRRLTASGFSAGTVTFYDSSAYGEPLAVVGSATAGIPQPFGRGEVLLHPGHYLVIVAAAITGSVTIFGAADLLPADFLPRYLG
jgi:hypothetical protein